jgi:hypothetical protein
MPNHILHKNINEQQIKFADSASIDGFARLRVSNPHTLFDSKQISTNLPLEFDDQETSGSGTTSTHNADTASTTLSVSNLTAGTRVRQSFRRFNYSSGKSHLILQTAQLSEAADGITARVGYFDENNGIYFESKDGAINVVRRSNTSGSPGEERVPYTSFNIDSMDGLGESGIAIDSSKTQILIIDIEWLGVGRVRMGFVVDGKVYYCHEFLNANALGVVFMSTPNLPLRYEISNDGTGPASSMQHICATVISEGGETNGTGITHFFGNGNTPVSCATAGTVYPLLAMRLKSTHLGTEVRPLDLHILSRTSDDYEWRLYFNPTISGGSFSFSAHTNSAIEEAVGDGTLTITAGQIIDGGLINSAQKGGAGSHNVDNAQLLGSAIDGTRDVLVLAVMPLGSGTVNASAQATITWKESL